MKNFSSIYEGDNDSIALEQKFFIKEETTRGSLEIPTGDDFLFTLGGGSVNFSQPVESSEHRSGRHHNSVIKQKTNTEFSFTTYFNIDTGVGVGTTQIDQALRAVLKQATGKEETAPNLKYTAADAPSTSFSIFENGDLWAKQAPGGFVNDMNMEFPGDGQATAEFSGMAKTSLLIGIGKSTVLNDANTVTVEAGEGARFKVGGLVMIIEADGTTRSDDTPDGSPRTITAISGDVITLDGAVLTDADGSAADIYLCYYEPETAAGINNPQTGLEGSITIAGLTAGCIRSLSLSMANDHEAQDFCFGEEGLSNTLFVPGSRFSANVSLELNLNDDLVEFINGLSPEFAGENIVVILGDSATRHMQITMPKVIFQLPSIEVPDSGTIPITFEGLAYQSALDAADEVQIEFL